MAPTTKLMAAMSGLVLLAAMALGLVVHRSIDAPALLNSLIVVAGLLGVALAAASFLGRTLSATPASNQASDRAAQVDKASLRPVLRPERGADESPFEQYGQWKRLFIAAVESASYPVITTTLDGIITAWNPAAERLYRYTAAEAIGQGVSLLIPLDRRDEHTVLMRKSIEDEPIENFETVRLAKDGRRIDVSLSIRPVKSPSGEIVGFAKIPRDITAEKFAEEKFRLAVESCPSGMVMVDRMGKIILVNTETERLFGYQRDELMGRPIDILVPERVRSHHSRHRDDFVRAPEARRMGAGRDLYGRRRDGTEFPVEVALNPIHTGEGLLVLSVIADISERKRVERLKDEFVSTVSHELRTPLTSISGSLGLLIGGAAGKLPEAAARLLSIAQTNSQRLVRLINDILDIEKIESGQIVFNVRRVDARSLVEQAIEANRGYADTFRVRVRLDSDASAGEVHADPDRLAQVITNLLSNAIKFSPADGEVVAGIEKRGDTVRTWVRDHGPGIPADFKPRIFEKFAQADATDARRKGGTGLGLSIVKQIVIRLGGEVGFDDAPCGGTIFHVDLPSLDRVAGREIDDDPGQTVARVLLCEDDPDTAVALRESLRQVGYATDFAHNRTDALARVTAAPYGAIVVDFQLPDGDGASLVRELRRQPQSYNTPIIAMTGKGGPPLDGGLSSSEIDALDWIDKPVDIDRLAQLLDRVALHCVNGRPHILHVDDEPEVLEFVAQALGAIANVTSADSAGAARRAIAAQHFDLAVLDISLGAASGLDLLPDLRGRDGQLIPVIIFSAQGTNPVDDPQVQASLTKSPAALESLVATVHDRLALRSVQVA
jgi:PAS domain S-box-containing protein